MSNCNRIDAFLSKLEGVKPTKDGHSARCPAHEDRQASLSINYGEDGRMLVKCHAGCPTEKVMAAVGMAMSDLFPPGHGNARRKPAGKPTARPKGVAYPTWGAAAEAVAKNLSGTVAATWPYHDAAGNEVARIVRIALPDGRKNYRPLRFDADGWRIGGIEAPRPLYCLPELAGETPVYVTEGEKAADAARGIGLTATTSMHGAQSPDKTDWTPLAGMDAVILPDNDPAGSEYATTVAGILSGLTPPPRVKIVELPDLPEKGDIFDWVESHDAAEPEALRAQVEKLADATPLYSPKVAPAQETVTPQLKYQPFPVELLPGKVRKLVVTAARAMACDPAFIAVPLLAVLAACIGNMRRLVLKRGWSEPAILWAVVVAYSGTMKTPGFKQALQALKKRQVKAFAENAEEMKRFKRELAEYKRDFDSWKKKKSGEPPDEPVEPEAHRFLVDDATVQALAPILQANWRGVLLAKDELRGWLGSFNQFNAGKGSDEAQWLSMHGGESITVDRRGGMPRRIFVPRASVSVTGTIQPDILHKSLGDDHRASGLAARLLFALPPRRPKIWTNDDIPPEVEDAVDGVIRQLLTLQSQCNAEGDPEPVFLGMDTAAKNVWIKFYNEHNQEQAQLDGDLCASWSKLEGYAARLALIIHLTRWAEGDGSVDVDKVDVASVEAGIALSRWFGNEAKRVYGVLDENDSSREHRKLIDLIERRGGSITIRELTQLSRPYRDNPEAAEKVLNGLVIAGLGEWEPVQTTSAGGRPTTRFTLFKASTVYETPDNPLDNGGSVDVDNRLSSENKDADDGEEAAEWVA